MNDSLLRLRILIVDDIPAHAARLCRKIAYLEHEVITLSEPRQAVQLIRSPENLYNPVDVAILDYFIPGTDGVQLGRELKQYDPDLSLIILSADASRETSREVLGSGLSISAFITKKEDIGVLVSSLNYLLANKELRLGGECSFLRERTSRYNGKELRDD